MALNSLLFDMVDLDLKRRLESLLFSSGRKIDVAELAKLCKEENLDVILVALKELQVELDEKNSSIMLVEEGGAWKFTVRSEYLPYVKKVVKQAELPKSLLETLAVVAFKSPVLQSQIIKIRTNKAYKHLEELEKNGFLSREKKGRTKLIKLSQKFFDYFDLPPEKIKDKFRNVAKIEQVIENKEGEIEMRKKEQKEKVEIYRAVERIEEPLPPVVEFVKDKLGALDVYDAVPKQGEGPPKLGDLEVYEREEKKKKKKQEVQQAAQAVKDVKQEEVKVALEEAPSWVKSEEKPKEAQEQKKESKPSKGMFPEGVPKDVEKKIDTIVDEIMHPKKEEKGEEEGEEQ